MFGWWLAHTTAAMTSNPITWEGQVPKRRMLSGGAGCQPGSRQMAGGQLGGDGQAPANQSAGRPKGIRRVSEGANGSLGRFV